MYKELGFTKTAVPLPAWAKVLKGAVMGSKPATEKVVGKIKHTREFASRLSQEAMAGAEGILNPFGWQSARQRLSAAKTKINPPRRGFALGLGAGVVGTAGAHAIFGRKERKTPYYPY